MPFSSFDFSRIIDRRGGDSLKWNKYAGRDVLPFWVADMDFAAPPAVLAAIEARVAQGCFGYAVPWPSLVEAVLEHLQREYAWRVDSDWLVWLPGLVTGINLACRSVDGGVLTAVQPENQEQVLEPSDGNIVQGSPSLCRTVGS